MGEGTGIGGLNGQMAGEPPLCRVLFFTAYIFSLIKIFF
jgi:hypothetical protein